MKNVTLLIFVLFLGYTTNAQVADSVLFELENDTVPADESKKSVKAKISFEDEEAEESESFFNIEIEDADNIDEDTDTIRMRIGNKKVIIIDDYSLNTS